MKTFGWICFWVLLALGLIKLERLERNLEEKRIKKEVMEEIQVYMENKVSRLFMNSKNKNTQPKPNTETNKTEAASC